MKTKAVTPELFRLPGDIVLTRAGVVAPLLTVAAAWRFPSESAGATANQRTNGNGEL